MRAFLFLISAMLAIGLTAIVALAQEPEPCAPWPAIQEQLADRYGEANFFIGTSPQGLKMHVFAGPNGTWTVILRSTDGDYGCVAASGDAWVGFAPPAKGEEG